MKHHASLAALLQCDICYRIFHPVVPVVNGRGLPVTRRGIGDWRTGVAKTAAETGPVVPAVRDGLMVQSVEKAFRVLTAFDGAERSMSLSEVALKADLDLSAAQRFVHTLERMGYLRKDASTRRLELTVRTLELGYNYMRGSALVERAMPYLQHLSKETEETVNLTVLDGTEIVFVTRFMSRHVLNTDVFVGMRLPAYCTGSGLAMLSRMSLLDATALLRVSDLKPYTPSTTWRLEDLERKMKLSAARGYAVTCEEIYRGDISIGAAVVDGRGHPLAAINVAVSTSRYKLEDAEAQFSPLVIAAAHSVSEVPVLKGRRAAR